MISNNEMGTFFSSSIAIGLWLLTLALLLYAPVRAMLSRKGQTQAQQ